MSKSVSAHPATCSQVVAFAFAYRRMVIVYGACPVTMTVFPIAYDCARWTLNQITGGNGMLSVILAVVFTSVAYRLVHRLARTKKALDLALARNEVRLPVMMLVTSSLASRYVFGPLVQWIGFPRELPPLISWVAGLRVALAMVLLNSTIVFRYICPKSMMRCSAVPLVSNPYDSHLLYLRECPFSILEPSDTAGQLLACPPLSRNAGHGRRFQRPVLAAAFAQVIVAILVGVLVAYTTAFDLFNVPIGENFARSAHMNACVLAALFPIIPLLDGSSHEIDPHQYLVLPKGWPYRLLGRVMKTLVATVTLVPLFSAASALLVTSASSWSYFLGLWPQLAVSCLVTSLYLLVLDECMRTAFFIPRAKLKSLVNEIYGDVMPLMRMDLEVILRSLLDDDGLVKEVWTPTLKPGDGDMFEQETRRGNSLTKELSTVLLSRNTGHPEAPLEEDVLRVAILESFGGSLASSAGKRRAGVASKRHQANVEQWFDPKLPKGDNENEPLVVPLVRALCLFASGMGEALAVCMKNSQTRTNLQKRTYTVETWKLPPGAIACGEFAIRGASRFIVRGLTESGRPLPDWKSSHLSMLVPTALFAAFQLRAGIQRYYDQRAKATSSVLKPKASGSAFSENSSLLQACDMAARDILHAMQAQKKSSPRRMDLPLNDECLNWIEQLQGNGPPK